MKTAKRKTRLNRKWTPMNANADQAREKGDVRYFLEPASAARSQESRCPHFPGVVEGDQTDTRARYEDGEKKDAFEPQMDANERQCRPGKGGFRFARLNNGGTAP
jgi:hypothetical protein